MSLAKSSPGYERHMDEVFEEERLDPQPDHTYELWLESIRFEHELSQQREQHRQDINSFLGTLQQRYRPSPSVREADRRSDAETGYHEER